MDTEKRGARARHRARIMIYDEQIISGYIQLGRSLGRRRNRLLQGAVASGYGTSVLQMHTRKTKQRRGRDENVNEERNEERTSRGCLLQTLQ